MTCQSDGKRSEKPAVGPARDISRLAIEYISLTELKPNIRNPRQHGERQIKMLGRSMQQFGFAAPILVDGGLNILAGHGRFLAAKKIGMAEVPIIRLADLTREEALAFTIADNRLTEKSEWNERLLGEIFAELSELDLTFSLEDTGFTMAEIDLKIEGLSETGADPDPADKVLVAEGEPITREGDCWFLDNHRIFCGNALEPESYKTLLQGSAAQIVFTDPPYNVKIDGHASGMGAVRHRDFAMASGEMSPEQFTDFLATVLGNLAAHTVDGAILFAFMDWRHQLELLTAADRTSLELKNLCVWVKDNGGMGSLYRSQHELIFVFKNGQAPHQNNVQLGVHGRNRTNVWPYPSINNFGKRGEEGNLLSIHPTVKPTALVADALLDCSARGDIVLDPFLGSGSTLMAAQRVGRVCRGIEIKANFVDTAITRWQRYTGGKAILARSGRTFDEIAIARGEEGADV